MQKLKDIMTDKKLMYYIFGGIAGIVILFGAIFIVLKMLGRKISYSELENQLYSETEYYLKENDIYYPNEENPETIISSEDLVQGKYIKELNKLVKDNCSAEIEVLYKNGGYAIRPLLSCDKYESQLFYDKILADNPVTDEGNGLHDLYEMLVFRGDRVNNYVKFNGTLWRIVKMNPVDNTIYLILDNVKEAPNDIWDDRYNTAEESRHGINDFPVSVISSTLKELYRTKFNTVKAKMVPMDICVGKRSNTETINDGSIECSYVMEEPEFVTLMQINDYINASTDRRCNTVEDPACGNYNYLVNKNGKWWTLTADGTKGTKVYSINYNGNINSDYANSKKFIRLMIAVDGNNLYQEGNGTSNNPYIMK